MALPKKFDLMLPLLKVVSRKEISMRDAAEILAKDFKLSTSEQSEMLSTGNKTRFFDRSSWARVYLRQAGLIDLPKRGYLKITKAGIELLAKNPPKIDIKVLLEYDEFREFLKRSEKQGRYIDSKMGVVTVPGSRREEDTSSESESSLHTEVQYKLLELGSRLGLSLWVARNDRTRSWKGSSFQKISGLMSELPAQFDPATHRTIELIDVLWMYKKSIVAAFEIETTTSIYSGLLRMSDLAAMQPNLSIKLFIVAPSERRNKVFQEINRPTFSRFSPTIAEMCKFLTIEKLIQTIENTKDVAKHLRPEFLYDVADACHEGDD